MQFASGTKIELCDSEQAIAKYIAKRRNECRLANGSVTQKRNPLSDAEINVHGFGSELAFSRLFNVYPDFTIGPNPPLHDCSLHFVRFDVKATAMRSGHLLVKIGTKPDAADVYALMEGRFPTYYFRGVATARELFRPDHTLDLGHGDNYYVEQADLSSFCVKHGTFRGEGNCPGCTDEGQQDY